MMAGVVPKRSTSGRKQWTLHEGGPLSSLKGLRSQLATEGCPESQVVLAKQLLFEQQCEANAEMKENEELGVYWLIKASEQGNIEATEILRKCLATGKGITDLNCLDVKSCIAMTQDEKLARRAAREMFANLSNGGEYITSIQLQKRMLAIDQKDDEIETNDWCQKLTEDHVVTAAIDYSHGHLPLETLCLSKPDLRALDHIPLVQRSILHPLLALKILYYKLIKFIGKKCSNFAFLKSEFQFLILLALYTALSYNNVIYLLPMSLYYATFIAMFVSTAHLLQVKREFHEFRMWSGLFICYSNGDLNPDEAEYLYFRNNLLKPLFTFFGSLLLNLLIYPVIVDQWIPQSELMIISFILTFSTLLGFLYRKRGKTVFDGFVFFSFGINVLAKYPYETDSVVAQGWRFLDLKVPTFASYIVGNGIEFCINFRLFLYLIIPLIFIKIAARDNWKGVYKFLIPHCVTLSWLQICIISSQGATTFGLLRGSLALVGVVLFLPLVGITSVILPAAALTKYIITSNVFLTIGVFLLITVLVFAICWCFAKSRYNKFGAFIQIVVMVFALISLLKSYQPYENKLPNYLPWDVYQRFCHQPIWHEENSAIAQMKCAQLHQAPIHWDGYIQNVQIKTITNRFQAIFSFFPIYIQEFLECFYGEKLQSDCSNFPKAVLEECVSFYGAMRRCTLEKYNSYSFEIRAKVQAGIWGKNPEITIIAEDFFKNFTLDLKPNDHVWFKGVLLNHEGVLGGDSIFVQLEELGCLACANAKLTSVRSVEWEFFKRIFAGVKFLVNVVLNPAVVFK